MDSIAITLVVLFWVIIMLTLAPWVAAIGADAARLYTKYTNWCFKMVGRI